MRFLCDEMLRVLGKWLRAAGYDTVVAEGGLPDPLVAARCAAEHRILLTRDRHLAAAAGAVTRVVLLRQGSIDADASALHNILGVNWHYAPFTRCLVDNCPLEPAPPQLAGAGAGAVARCRRAVADLPRLPPPLLARRPCPPHAAAARQMAKCTRRSPTGRPARWAGASLLEQRFGPAALTELRSDLGAYAGDLRFERGDIGLELGNTHQAEILWLRPLMPRFQFLFVHVFLLSLLSSPERARDYITV